MDRCISRKTYVDIVLNSLKYCIENKQLKLFAWCIMTNHIHLIAQSSKGDLSGTLRDFKKFTSSTIIETIEQSKEESRKNWMLWIFKKAGERNSRNKDFSILAAGKSTDTINYPIIYIRKA